MKPQMPSSPQWTSAEVLKQLKKAAGKGKPVQAHVFLNDDVAVNDLTALAQQLVADAERGAGKRQTAPEIGKVHRLAKSFSLKADPDTLAAVASMPAVKTILPSEISDILPRPVKARPLTSR